MTDIIASRAIDPLDLTLRRHEQKIALVDAMHTDLASRGYGPDDYYIEATLGADGIVTIAAHALAGIETLHAAARSGRRRADYARYLPRERPREPTPKVEQQGSYMGWTFP
jgi:hypothetical protein